VVGRLLFAPFAGFKPVTALVIICGLSFGPIPGLLCGAGAALVSDLFFGLGPWTLVQMLLWGLIGLVAGASARRSHLLGAPAVMAFGVLASLVFGVLSDSAFVWLFLRPTSWVMVGLGYLAGLVPNLIHALSTVVFLALLYLPWRSRFRRIKRKYGLQGL
jgi:energy-coupling factor transport system substrate-specific component